MRKRIVAIASLICMVAASQLLSHAQNALSDSQDAILLYTYDDTTSQGSYLGSVSQSGVSSVEGAFADGADFISPDRTKIALLDLEGNLQIINYTGDVLLTYEFDPQERMLWGWLNDTSLVVSRRDGSALSFYEFDISSLSPSLTSIDYLNEAFIWDMEQVMDWAPVNFNPYALIQFSPDFRFAITPAGLPTISGDAYKHFQADEVALWNLVNRPSEAVEIITGIIPWWYESSAIPIWSPNGNAVVFGKYDDKSLGIYTVDMESSPDRLSDVICPTTEACIPTLFSWSFDHSKVAYWTTSTINRTGQHNLMLIDVGTGEQSILLENMDHISPIFWSSDNHSFAFVKMASDTAGTSYEVSVLDTESSDETILLKLSVPVRLLGWLRP